ncbi:MAG: methyltransferase domain-containing protein [Pseudanabaenaceae cyanobacterium bins.39]|nr:methyltransferase domain-containing protein [Pseudanabaenaceae cyanobacterium bins.39]
MKLHIGGTSAHPDWKIFDIEKRDEVDFVGDAADLSQFEDESVDAIYASHVLEHFHHSLNYELVFTLAEWHRVLKKGGQLMISVPDIKTLSWLYSRPNLDLQTRFHIMAMMFGGQTNQYDVHRVGFDFDILCMYLREVGFSECQRVESFNLFDDCSTIQLMGTLISLNAIATK